MILTLFSHDFVDDHPELAEQLFDHVTEIWEEHWCWPEDVGCVRLHEDIDV